MGHRRTSPVGLVAIAALSWAACQCGPSPAMRLAGPELLLRTGSARYQVSVLGPDGQPASGPVFVQSDVGSLQAGLELPLGLSGAADLELRCSVDEDPRCLGEFVTLTATWKGQQVERKVRLVDVLPMDVGPPPLGGGSFGGGPAGGRPTMTAGGSGGAGAPGCQQMNSLGCEFLVAAVPPELATRGSCYAVVLANGGTRPVSIDVTYDQRPLPPSFIFSIAPGTQGQPAYAPLAQGGTAMLPANEVAVLFLGDEIGPASMRVSCPRPAAIRQAFQTLETTRAPTFRITTSGPVAAYDIYPYGGAGSFVASASLLLPTRTYGTTSVSITPAPSIGAYHSFLQVFARDNATTVRIEAPVAIVGSSTVAPSAARQIVTRTLGAGEVLQLHQPADLGGSTIRSDKPVAVWGGHTCMQVPIGTPACDSAHQHLPPVAHLGSEYVGVQPPARFPDEPATWRLVGTAAGTRLTWTPPIAGAPTRLGPGQVVEFSAPGPFVVRAQDSRHPFLATQLMTGAFPVPMNVGDPEFVLLVPPGQFLSSYLFFTDHTYRNTHLVFVRKSMNGTFADVTLDCPATFLWQATADPDFEYATVSWTGDAQTGCTNGIRRASSTAPFGLTVWGTDRYVSYAYPAGMGVNQLNTVDPDPIPVEP
jgi:hypothetical protein